MSNQMLFEMMCGCGERLKRYFDPQQQSIQIIKCACGNKWRIQIRTGLLDKSATQCSRCGAILDGRLNKEGAVCAHCSGSEPMFPQQDNQPQHFDCRDRSIKSFGEAVNEVREILRETFYEIDEPMGLIRDANGNAVASIESAVDIYMAHGVGAMKKALRGI